MKARFLSEVRWHRTRAPRALSLALLAVAALGAPRRGAADRVRNPGFERLDGNGAPRAWGLPRAPGVRFGVDRDVRRSGTASGRIDALDPGAQTRFVQAWRQVVPLEPQTSYWLAVWVRGSAVGNGRIAVLHRDADGTVLLNQPLDRFSGRFDWKQVGGEFTLVKGAVEVQLVIGIQKSAGTAWFDDISLEKAGDAAEMVGSWAFTPKGTLVAGKRTPVVVQAVLGDAGLAPGGTLALQWENWRPAREFRFSALNAVAEPGRGTFDITVPPRKKSWPPTPRPIACIATWGGPEPLAPGTRVRIEADLVPSPHSNVISPLSLHLQPSASGMRRAFPSVAKVQSTGSEASQLACVAEMRPVRGRPGRVTVALTDRFGNPASSFRGVVRLACPGSDLSPELAFTPDDRGRRTLQVTVAEDRVSRIRASWGKLAVVSNPILPRDPSTPGVYVGDIHSHCEISGDGVGDPDLAHDYARYVHGLDFACLSDHSPRGKRWQRLLEVNARHNDPGHYVALVGYEWSSKPWGHRNAYFPTDTAPEQPTGLGNNHAAWWDWLHERQLEALTVPHHTNTQAAQILASGRPAWEPCDWSVINHTYQRVVEICQNRGSFEIPGGPNKELRVYREDVGASVQTALAMGHRLAFIGSTDTHSGRPGTGQARCVVVTSDLTRRGVWQALYDRHCYATTGPHVYVEASLNGEPMGRELRSTDPSRPRDLRWRVVTSVPVARVDVLRCNDVVDSIDGQNRTDMQGTYRRTEPLRNTEWWYIRARMSDGNLAWSSPIWMDP